MMLVTRQRGRRSPSMPRALERGVNYPCPVPAVPILTLGKGSVREFGMSEPLFKVVFDGQLVLGADLAAVKAELARLFKVDPARIDAMFGSAPVVVRRQLDEATARQYLQALEKAGALARLEPMEPVAPEAAEPASAATRAAVAAAPGASKELPAPVPAALATPAPAVLRAMQGVPVAPALDVAAAGALLVEAPDIPDANIAIEHLSLAAVGTPLADARDIPEPAYDLSAMSLAPVGTHITEPEDVPEAEFDLSALSLAPQPQEPGTAGRAG